MWKLLKALVLVSWVTSSLQGLQPFQPELLQSKLEDAVYNHAFNEARQLIRQGADINYQYGQSGNRLLHNVCYSLFHVTKIN